MSAVAGRETEQSAVAVVMARLVDRRGRVIGAADVRAIEFSMYRQMGEAAGGARKLIGPAGRALCVGDVVCDTLRQDTGWEVDGGGYNFRHEVSIPIEYDGEMHLRQSVSGRRGSRPIRYELRYTITQATGESTVVRFHIRTVSDERC